MFGDDGTARRAASLAAPALVRQAKSEAQRARTSGNPTAQAGVTSATPLGRAVLVYIAGTTFGSGEPITPAALAATRDCVRGAGYG